MKKTFENEIIEKFKKEGRCTKYVENGKAICGVKLDCHLHDWREKGEIEQALTKQRAEILGIVKGMEIKSIEEFEERSGFDFDTCSTDVIYNQALSDLIEKLKE